MANEIVSVINTPSDQIVSKFNVTLSYVAKTADYPLTLTDYTVDFTANNCIATLPTAVGIAGKIYQINNSGNGLVTVATTSSQTINGAVSGAIKLSQYDQLTVQSTGSNWILIH